MCNSTQYCNETIADLHKITIILHKMIPHSYGKLNWSIHENYYQYDFFLPVVHPPGPSAFTLYHFQDQQNPDHLAYADAGNPQCCKLERLGPFPCKWSSNKLSISCKPLRYIWILNAITEGQLLLLGWLPVYFWKILTNTGSIHDKAHAFLNGIDVVLLCVAAFASGDLIQIHVECIE